jgi:DNA-binding transcriptional LysR family regulator
MQSMDWNDLRHILAVARAGTLAGAARRLGVNQTTVARRIAAAEAALGTRLYDRSGGLLRPTPTGETAVARAAAIEQDVLVLEQGASRADTQAAGMVRLTAVPVLANRLLVPAFPRLASRHPRLRLELIAESRNLSLSRREADIALRLARPEGASALLTRRLGRLDYAVYGPRGRTSARLPWIDYEEGRSHLPQARWLSKAAAGELRLGLLAGDIETILQAIHAGLGKSLLPRVVADGDSRLKCLSGPGAVLSREVWLLTHHELRSSPRIVAVVDWLTEVVKTSLR